MKKLILLSLLFILTIARTYATDIVVEEFGITPAYPSITDAVAAANDGDRIIIKNRAGNIPWIENITITKSLEFLPFDNDTFFIVQGNYTINIASGKTVSIIGMKNTSGGINTTSAPVGSKVATINIMGCYFLSGVISLQYSGYGVNTINTKLDNGNIVFCYGNVIGCDVTCAISNQGILITGGNSVLNDTIAIIGNKVNMINSYDGIYLGTTTSRFTIRNNFIKHRSTGISINYACAGNNYIYNNTIASNTTSSSALGITISYVYTGQVVEVMNNVIDATSTGTTYGIYNGSSNSGTINVYYNHVDVTFNYPVSTGFTYSGNNFTSSSISLASDGRLSAGNAAINNGNPAAPYYDLDLSIGDPGAYGGSYTIDNFFPIHAGAARVYLSTYPFNVRQGNTLNIKANTYDR